MNWAPIRKFGDNRREMCGESRLSPPDPGRSSRPVLRPTYAVIDEGTEPRGRAPGAWPTSTRGSSSRLRAPFSAGHRRADSRPPGPGPPWSSWPPTPPHFLATGVTRNPPQCETPSSPSGSTRACERGPDEAASGSSGPRPRSAVPGARVDASALPARDGGGRDLEPGGGGPTPAAGRGRADPSCSDPTRRPRGRPRVRAMPGPTTGSTSPRGPVVRPGARPRSLTGLGCRGLVLDTSDDRTGRVRARRRFAPVRRRSPLPRPAHDPGRRPRPRPGGRARRVGSGGDV